MGTIERGPVFRPMWVMGLLNLRACRCVKCRIKRWNINKSCSDPPGDGLSAAVERQLGHGSGSWQSLLAEIVAALDTTAAAIVCHHPGVECTGAMHRTVICQCGRGRPESADYRSTLRSGAAVSLGELGRSGREGTRVCPGDQIWTSRLSPGELDYRLCAVLAVEENDVTVLELDRPPDRAPFGAAEVEGLERLLPGLQLAVRCLLRSGAIDMQARVFNRLPVAVAQIGANREILFHNHALRYLLAQADGLRVASDRIRACAVQEDRVLADRVRRAIAGIRADDLLPIRRPSGRPAYLVHIGPLGHRAHRRPANAGTAMMVALSPGDCDREAIVRFGTAYGLTGAEIRIVQFMLEGQGIDDIAGRLQGSANTVRWHLKSVYAKTGAAGQADLVRLFMHAIHLSIA